LMEVIVECKQSSLRLRLTALGQNTKPNQKTS
jgi:hypothetical protein